AADRDALELRLDRLFGARIERRGGLVEDQNSWILEERARDGDALLLAAGEFQSAFTDHRLVAGRQRHDEVVDVRRARGLVHLRVARFRPAIADVVKDGVVEKYRVLRNDADGRA